MDKSISTVIQEMKHHRNSFMKKSTPYRQLNRAIKQLEKLEKIEQIVNSRDGFYLYDNLPPFQQIREVLEQDN